MLGEMRKHSKSTGIYILFAIIIIVFVFTFNTGGGGKGGCGGQDEVVFGHVGSNTIDSSNFFMALAMTPDPPEPGTFSQKSMYQMEMYNKTRFFYARGDMKYRLYMPDAEEISPIKIQRVVDDLIETYLVSDVAMEMGLTVTSDELKKRIYTDQWFDPETGKFLKKSFKNYVAFNLHTSQRGYEEFIKREMLREKLISLLTASVSATKPELDYYTGLIGSTVDLEFVQLTPDVVAPLVSVPAAEVQAYVKDHAKEIEDYYNSHKADYVLPEKVTLRTILFKAPSLAAIEEETDEAKKETLTKSREATKKIAEKALTDLAAKLPAAAGDADTSSATNPLTDEAVITAFATLAATSGDLATKATGGLWTAPMAKDEIIASTYGEPVATAAFELEDGGLSDEIVEADDGFWIVARVDSTAQIQQTLAQVQDKVATALIQKDKAPEKVKVIADALLAHAKKTNSESLDKALETFEPAKGVTIAVKKTGAFSRLKITDIGSTTSTFGAIPFIGIDEELFADAFGLTAEAPYGAKVYHKDDSTKYFVVRLAEASSPEGDDLQLLRDDIEMSLVAYKKRMTYRTWYNDLKDKAVADGKVSLTDLYQQEVAKSQQQYQEALQKKLKKQGGGALPITMK